MNKPSEIHSVLVTISSRLILTLICFSLYFIFWSISAAITKHLIAQAFPNFIESNESLVHVMVWVFWTVSSSSCRNATPHGLKTWSVPFGPVGGERGEYEYSGSDDFIHQDQQGAKGSVWGYGAWWIRSDTGSSSLLFLRSALQRLERGSRFQPSTAALLCQNTATSTSAGVTWDANMCRCLGLSLTWTLNLLSNIWSSLCLFIIYCWVVYTKMNILSIFTLHWNHERLLNENDSHLCPWKKEGNACLEWHECEEMMTYL